MMVSKDIYRLILVVVLSICGMYAYAQEPSGNSTKVSSVRQQMKCSWQYFAVLDKDKIVISYGCKCDYYSENNKLLFTKIKKIMSAIKYYKD